MTSMSPRVAGGCPTWPHQNISRFIPKELTLMALHSLDLQHVKTDFPWSVQSICVRNKPLGSSWMPLYTADFFNVDLKLPCQVILSGIIAVSVTQTNPLVCHLQQFQDVLYSGQYLNSAFQSGRTPTFQNNFQGHGVVKRALGNVLEDRGPLLFSILLM